jgi:hypothetical protein
VVFLFQGIVLLRLNNLDQSVNSYWSDISNIKDSYIKALLLATVSFVLRHHPSTKNVVLAQWYSASGYGAIWTAAHVKDASYSCNSSRKSGGQRFESVAPHYSFYFVIPSLLFCSVYSKLVC